MSRARGWWPVAEVPSSVDAALSQAGWQRVEADEGGMRLLWVGTDWSEGLQKLVRSGREQERSRTVLVGHDPPRGIGERIREHGGLTWLTAGCPPWMLDLLDETLDRARRELPVHRLGAVAELEARSDADVDGFLHALAEHLSELLDAEASVWFRQHDTFVRWPTSDAPGEPPPAGLPEHACNQLAPVIAPYLPESRRFFTAGAPHVAAAALCLARRTAVGEPDVVLVLTWSRPFLPTPGEYRLIELLGVFGRLNVRRLRDRASLDGAHRGHVTALAAMLPQPTATPVDGVRRASREPSVDAFVQRVLQSHAGHAELLALAIRLSPSSRGAPGWHRLPTAHPLDDEACERAVSTLRRGEPAPGPGDSWWLINDIGRHGAFGQVVASFSSRSAAREAQPGLIDLTASLALGAQLHRWSEDSLALSALAEHQTRVTEPRLALAGMIDRIRARMDADHARLHVVVRTGLGPVVTTPWQSDGRSTVAAPASLSDVLRHGEWTRDVSESPTAHQLLVPLFAGETPAGVLEVWRESPEPFDHRHDPAALRRFAPHVAAACKRLLHVALLERRSAEMASLLQALEPLTPTRTAAALVLERVGTLAGASAGVLLRRAGGSEGRVYLECVWTHAPDKAELFALAVAEVELETSLTPWTAQVGGALAAPLAAWGLERLHHRATLTSLTPLGTQPTSAIALFDQLAEDDTLRPFAPEAQDEAAAELFHYAAALLENATRSTARVAAEQLSLAVSEPRALAAAAAGIIQKLTDADAVLVALGDRTAMSVEYVWPERQSLIGRKLPHEAQLAEALPELARTFGWAGVRGARLEALVDRGRWLGAMLVLSAPSGPELGWHRGQIVQAVASRLAFEVDKARRHAMIDDLNVRAARLAVHHGKALETNLVSELTAWTRAHLRADGRVVAVVRAHGHQTLLVAGDRGDDQSHLRALNLASRHWGQVVVRWTPANRPDDLVGFEGLHGLAMPFVLPGQETLTGHLVVLSGSPFTDEHVPLAREAARELAVVLEGERVRHGFMAATGVFRHALLAPVQGLTDAALFLAELSKREAAPAEQLDRQRVRIATEAEKVRRWRAIQNIYGGGLLGGEIHLRPRRQSLRPLVEGCVERFHALLASRNIALQLDWTLRGRDLLPYDTDAVDIILSNLLDNAAKYAFYNRYVTVSVREVRDRVQLTVADIGHPVPEHINIYEAGARLDWEDPFRTIYGEGLGLRIARSLAVAHGGHLEHSCVPEHADAAPDHREETRPYLVQFTVSLPR